jgi:hypothetical protein
MSISDKPENQNQRELVFPEIDPNFLDTRILRNTVQSNSSRVLLLAQDPLSYQVIGSTTDTVLQELYNIENTAPIHSNPIDNINWSLFFQEIVGLYPQHWGKLLTNKFNITNILAIINESSIQDRPGRQWFDQRYIKVLSYILGKYNAYSKNSPN